MGREMVQGAYLPVKTYTSAWSRINNLTIPDVQYFMQHWRKLGHQEGEPCPVGRGSHSAVCLGYGGDHPHLFITGGIDKNNTVLNDAWMLDLQSGKWKEVTNSIGISTLCSPQWSR